MLDSALGPSCSLSKNLLLLPWILKLIVDMVNDSTPLLIDYIMFRIFDWCSGAGPFPYHCRTYPGRRKVRAFLKYKLSIKDNIKVFFLYNKMCVCL